MYSPRPENADWFETILASLEDPLSTSPLGEKLPGFPDETLQSNTTGISGEATMSAAFGFYEDVLEGVASGGSNIEQDWQILDFGSCWGRITRLFMRHVPKAQITGLDVEETFNQVARELFSYDGFRLCTPRPPADLPDRSIDLVTAYSVFSHLAEPVALEWIEEFSRVLRPGGFLAFTSRHDSFFDYLTILARDTAAEGYRKALGEMFADLDAARTRYRAGEFVFSNEERLSGGGALDGSFYGEAFIPTQYVERNYTRWFDVVAAKFDPERHDQMLFVLRRTAE